MIGDLTAFPEAVSRLDVSFAGGSSCGVRFARVLFALVLVCLLAGLATAAYADPPDPSWLGGYWDDDDFDDAIILLLGTYAVVELPPADTGRPGDLVVTFVQSFEPLVAPPPVDAAASPRAPPPTSASA